MKRLLVVFVAIAVVAVAALLWLASSLDDLVRSAIERTGSELLGTRVDVGSVSIDLRSGAGSVRALRIANPAGNFGPGPAIALEEVSLAIDLGSLSGEPIVLDSVRVARPEVNGELRGAALNLDVLRRNLAGSSTPDEAGADAEGQPVRLTIRRFEFAEGALRLDTGDAEAEPRELVLPSFTMHDVGGPDGATSGVIGQAILGRLLSHATAYVAARRAQGEAEAWIDEKLEEEHPGAADAAKQVLEGLLGDD